MTGHALTTMLESEAGYITHTHTHTQGITIIKSFLELTYGKLSCIIRCSGRTERVSFSYTRRFALEE